MLGNYLGTDGLESILADTDDQPPGKQLGDINTLYSRFRPYRLVEKKVQWKHPAGDVPGSRTFGQANYYGNNSTVRNFSVAQNYGGDYTGQPVESEAGQPDTASSSQQQSSEPGDSRSLDSSQGDRSEREELPQSASDSASRTQHDSDSNAETTRRRSTRLSAVTSGPPPPHTEKIRVLVNLDDGDNLQQLIANVDLAVPGPRPDIFRALQHIVSDGYLRVWRWWLAERSQLQKQLDDAAADAIVEDEVLASDANAASTGKGKGRLTESDATMTAPDYKKDESILWVGHRSLVGVRLSVREKKWNRPAPVLMRASDDGPASYEIVYEGTFSQFSPSMIKFASIFLSLLSRTDRAFF